MGYYPNSAHLTFDEHSVRSFINSLCVDRLRFDALLFTVSTCGLYKGHAHMDRLSVVIGICLVECSALVWLWALLKRSRNLALRIYARATTVSTQ